MSSLGWTPEYFLDFFRRKGYCPSDERRLSAKKALNDLVTLVHGQDVVSRTYQGTPHWLSTKSGWIFIVWAVMDAFALGVWNVPMPIVCSIAGTPSVDTFFWMTRATLRADPRVNILKASRDKEYMFELSFGNFKFLLVYHQSPLARNWFDPNVGMITGAADHLPLAASKKFEKYGLFKRDFRSITDVMVFRAAYFSLVYWADLRGHWSTEFGYLGERQITDLVIPSLRPSYIETMEQIFTDGHQKPNPYNLDGSSGSPFERAVKNLRHKKDILDEVIKTQTLKHTLNDWIEILSLPAIPLVESCERLLAIELSYSGVSKVQYGRLVNSVEACMINLACELKDGMFRVWPRRYKAAGSNEQGDYCSYYFAFVESGNARTGGSITGVRPIHRRMNDATQTLVNYLEDNGPQNNTSTFLNVKPATEISMSELKDDDDWSLTPPAPKREDEDDEDDEVGNPWLPETSQPKKKPEAHNKPSSTFTSPSEKTPPLRPALHVLARILHDPHMDEDDYVIGYMDRHSGTQEIPVALWPGRDATHDDFIPQWRIQYFRRKSEDQPVWDRETKLDFIFKSGSEGERARVLAVSDTELVGDSCFDEEFVREGG